MIDLTKWHNWVAIGLISLGVAFVIRQVGARVPAVGTVAQAAYGN